MTQKVIILDSLLVPFERKKINCDYSKNTPSSEMDQLTKIATKRQKKLSPP